MTVQDPNARVALASTMALAAFAALALYVAPALATAYINELGFRTQDSGFVISAEMAGMGLATFPALWWVNRISWPRLLHIALLGLIVANIACVWTRSAAALATVRFLAGLAEGTVSIVCMSALRLTANPERNFAAWVVAQLAVGALCLALLPFLLARAGVAGFFVALAVVALCLLGLAGSIFDGSTARRPAKGADPTREGASKSGILKLGALLAFYTAFSCLWAFLSEIALASGIAASAAVHVLALAPIAGILGAVLAALCGQRLGSLTPLALGMLALAVAAFRLGEGLQLVSFLVSATAFMLAFSFVVPYLLGGIAIADRSGRLIVATSVTIGLALAVGPALGGAIVAHASYQSITRVSMSLCLVSFLLSLPMSGKHA